MPRLDYPDPGLTEALVESGARVANGDSGVLGGFGFADTLRLQLNVTAVAGTAPTLDVVIEDTLDGANWNTIATFAQKTAVGREVINVSTPFTNRLRVRWTIGGTMPSFTFAVHCYSE